MNAKIALETLSDFSANVLELAPGRPAHGNPKAAGVQGPLEILLPIPMLEESGLTGYRYWGINE